MVRDGCGRTGAVGRSRNFIVMKLRLAQFRSAQVRLLILNMAQFGSAQAKYYLVRSAQSGLIGSILLRPGI